MVITKVHDNPDQWAVSNNRFFSTFIAHSKTILKRDICVILISHEQAILHHPITFYVIASSKENLPSLPYCIQNQSKLLFNTLFYDQKTICILLKFSIYYVSLKYPNQNVLDMPTLACKEFCMTQVKRGGSILRHQLTKVLSLNAVHPQGFIVSTPLLSV